MLPESLTSSVPPLYRISPNVVNGLNALNAAVAPVCPVPPLDNPNVPPMLSRVKLASTASISISLFPVSSVIDILLDPLLMFFNSKLTPVFCL